MLGKIFLIPRKILRKIYSIILSEINEIIFPYKKRKILLEASYKSFRLLKDRNNYIKKLNKCLFELGFPKFDENLGMYSEHLVIFTALANSDFKPKNILEIGTHDGKSASILSTLFPEAKITTLDLKDTDPLFIM